MICMWLSNSTHTTVCWCRYLQQYFYGRYKVYTSMNCGYGKQDWLCEGFTWHWSCKCTVSMNAINSIRRFRLLKYFLLGNENKCHVTQFSLLHSCHPGIKCYLRKILQCSMRDWGLRHRQNETHLMNIFPELRSQKIDNCEVHCRLNINTKKWRKILTCNYSLRAQILFILETTSTCVRCWTLPLAFDCNLNAAA